MALTPSPPWWRTPNGIRPGQTSPPLHPFAGIRVFAAGSVFCHYCTQNNEYLFGDVVDGGMVLNDAGQMVQGAWDELPANYPGIETDVFIVMPNHVHGIITIQPPDAKSSSSTVGAGPRACPPLLRPPREQPTPTGPPSRTGHPPPPCGCPVCQRQYESSASNPRQGGLRPNRLSCGEE